MVKGDELERDPPQPSLRGREKRMVKGDELELRYAY